MMIIEIIIRDENRPQEKFVCAPISLELMEKSSKEERKDLLHKAFVSALAYREMFGKDSE